jgi:hypothetical protein
MIEKNATYGRLAILAPLALVAALAAVLVMAVGPQAAWIAGAGLAIAATGAGGWYALSGLARALRIGSAAAGVLAACGLAWLLFWMFQALAVVSDLWVMLFIIVAPLILLVVECTISVRTAGVRPRHLLASWIAALVALLAAYPLALQVTMLAGRDDMNELIVVIVPLVALLVWTGSLIAAAIGLLLGRPAEGERAVEATA